MAAACKEKSVNLVEAPVSGMPVVAEKGELSIMVGADEADLFGTMLLAGTLYAGTLVWATNTLESAAWAEKILLLP